MCQEEIFANAKPSDRKYKKRSEKIICDRKYENSFSAVHNNFTLYALTSNINKLHSRRQRTELRMILNPTLGQIAFGDRSMKTDTY